jgi:hypothetical protein
VVQVVRPSWRRLDWHSAWEAWTARAEIDAAPAVRAFDPTAVLAINSVISGPPSRIKALLGAAAPSELKH